MITTEDKVSKALDFLATTDKSHAEAKARCKFLDQKRKTVKAVAFNEAEGKSNEVKTNKAYASQEYKDVCDEIKSAEYDYQILTNQRLRATLTIDVWRSEFSARKQGIIT